MLAIANTRRDLCLNRCPLGNARCAPWTASSGAMVADPAAFCPAGAWHETYYNATRRAAAPTQVAARLLRPPPTSPGPGTILKRMLGWLRIKATGNCACNRRAAEMDLRGVDWCSENLETIIHWLREEAIRRALPFNTMASRWLIRLAITLARLMSKWAN